MADKLMQPGWDPLVLAAQLQNIAKQSQTLMQRFVSNQPDALKLGIGDTSSLGFDFFELMTKMMTNPAAVASAQIDLFNDTLNVWQKTAERMLMLRAQEANAPKDKRFKHPEWSENAIFSFVKDSYLVAAKSILSAVRAVKGMDDATARRLDFYTRQFVDALSPSNRQLWTRPPYHYGEGTKVLERPNSLLEGFASRCERPLWRSAKRPPRVPAAIAVLPRHPRRS